MEETKTYKTYTVNSSHGTLEIDGTGKVLECSIDREAYDHDEPCNWCIDIIQSFDLQEHLAYWKRVDGTTLTLEGGFDILDLGGTNKDGSVFTADLVWREDVKKRLMKENAVVVGSDAFVGNDVSEDEEPANVHLLTESEVNTLLAVLDWAVEQDEMANYLTEGCPEDHIQVELFKYSALVGRIQGLPEDKWDITWKHPEYGTNTKLEATDVPAAIEEIKNSWTGAIIRDIMPSEEN